MHHTARPVPVSQAWPAHLGAGYLDIETTGLDPRRHRVIAVGLLHDLDAGQVVEQWFADEGNEEPTLLALTARRLAQFGRIVTYNGSRFDLPFLGARAARCQVEWPQPVHEDLMSATRRWRLGSGCPDCCLQTVLEHLGVQREDRSAGSTVPLLYRRWLARGDPADRDAVLSHNLDDLLGLPVLSATLHRTGTASDVWSVVR